MQDNRVDSLIYVLNDINNYNGRNDLRDPIANLKRYNILLLTNITNVANVCNGAICEFGVYQGYTFNLLMHFFGKQFEYHGFDSFQGLSEPTRLLDNDTYDGCGKGNMTCPRDDVINYLNSVNDLSQYNTNFHEGWVSDTVPDKLPKKIAFAHVDVDLYEPTLHILRNIIPKMEKGGLILIDDYMDDNWKGVENACSIIEKEFNVKIRSLNMPLNKTHRHTMYQGYILF